MNAKSILVGTLGIVLGISFGIESGMCGKKAKSTKSSDNIKTESSEGKSGFQKMKYRRKMMKTMTEVQKEEINNLEAEKRALKKKISSLERKKQDGEELQELKDRLEVVRARITNMVYGPVDPEEFASDPEWVSFEGSEPFSNAYSETDLVESEGYDDTDDNGFERFISGQFESGEDSSDPIEEENEISRTSKDDFNKMMNHINAIYRKIGTLTKRLLTEEKRVNRFGEQSNQNAKDIAAIRKEIADQMANLKQTLDMQFSLLNQKISQPGNNGLNSEMLMLMMLLMK